MSANKAKKQNGRAQNNINFGHSRIRKPHKPSKTRASYRLHLKTHSQEKEVKRRKPRPLSISRTVELIKSPVECGNIASKLLFMASLNLCPKPGFVIAPNIVITRADPVLVEKIKVRQEKERKERARKTHQERMARLISIKNRGLLFPPKPVECIDLASDDDEDQSSKQPQQQSANTIVSNNNDALLRKMLRPTINLNRMNTKNLVTNNKMMHLNNNNGLSLKSSESRQLSLCQIPIPVTNNDILMSMLESPTMSGLQFTGCDINRDVEEIVEVCPDFILGDIHNDSFSTDDDPPDGNNNFSESGFGAAPDEFNPQAFVSTLYDDREEDVILID